MYERIYKSHNGKNVPLARYLMEQHLGRKLDRLEIVHHKDGDSLNNNIENLEIVDHSTHAIKHIENGDNTPWGSHEKHVEAGKKSGASRRKIPPSPDVAWCNTCKEFLPREKFFRNARRWNGVCFECIQCYRDRDMERKWIGLVKTDSSQII